MDCTFLPQVPALKRPAPAVAVEDSAADKRHQPTPAASAAQPKKKNNKEKNDEKMTKLCTQLTLTLALRIVVTAIIVVPLVASPLPLGLRPILMPLSVGGPASAGGGWVLTASAIWMVGRLLGGLAWPPTPPVMRCLHALELPPRSHPRRLARSRPNIMI